MRPFKADAVQAGELLSQKGGNTLTNLYAANK